MGSSPKVGMGKIGGRSLRGGRGRTTLPCILSDLGRQGLLESALGAVTASLWPPLPGVLVRFFFFFSCQLDISYSYLGGGNLN